MFPKILFSIISIILILQQSECKLTMEQLHKSGELMHTACKLQHKTSDELIKGLNKKEFPDDKNLKCYANCILEMMQITKNGKLNVKDAVKQIKSMIPEELTEETLKSVEICKNTGKDIKDSCDSGYEVMKCFYENGEKFMMP